MKLSLLSTVDAWDNVSEGYSEVTVGLFRTYSDAALDLLSVDPSHRILDVACGPGTLSLAAAERGAHVTALDFSEKMIGILKRTIAAQKIDIVDACIGDGQDLPFDDGAFDAAFSMFGLMFFPDRAAGFRELHRTLRPGGKVCVSSWVPISESPLMRVMLQAFQTINPNVPNPSYDVESLENPDILRAEMGQAGFEDIAIHRVEGGATFSSASEYWEGMAKGAAPVAMMKSSMAEDEWKERSKPAVAFVEENAGPFPTTLSATAFLGTGLKPL